MGNLHSPLLKSKMMHFEQILINTDHYQYSKKKENDPFKLVTYKTEMLKKLKRGMKNINKTFNTNHEEDLKDKNKKIRKQTLKTKSFVKTSTNSDKLPNLNETIQ